jgi:carboxyl-terminal processing protease
MSRSNYKPSVFFPMILSGIFVLGFVIGNFYDQGASSTGMVPISKSKNFNKLSDVMSYIDQEYVDSIERQRLTDKLISYLLQELDPHSYYMSAEEANRMNEPLEGGFDGIGVQFRIQEDTVVVINPVVGGPSEKLGIRAGDRIIEVDDENIGGVGITNSDVMRLLKGPRGTKVKVGIKRGNRDLIEFNITRDRIPITSLDASYMIDDKTGYIKVARFSRSTGMEFREAGESLLDQGMNRLVLDLRGNGGGILFSAAEMADEFLSMGKLIVYTEGKARRRENHYATSEGVLEEVELAVLIDEASASASEIIAGAIQDNDRGVIIGRRSFGKGLVQEQSNWPDGSATRLTIARYYTPTGRCIQKPYDDGTEAYNEDYYHRLESGELSSADSIKVNDTLKYTTPGGKVVYGGGGIVPDIFIPIDTSGGSFYLSELFYTGQLYDFCFDYADKNREKLGSYASSKDFIREFGIDNALLENFVDYAESNGVERDEEGLKRSYDIIRLRLKAGIARNIWGDSAFYPILNEDDPAIREAVIALGES